MATTTTTTVIGSIMTRVKNDRISGASSTETEILIPFKTMSDAGITPKENDYIVDGNDTWHITGVDQDPLQALYKLRVIKL